METLNKTKTHAALFADKTSAEAAYNAAIQRGLLPENVNIVMSAATRKKYYPTTVVKTEAGDKSVEGLAVGGAVGGTVLGVIGAVVALSSTIVVPGLGLVIAGPLAAGLIGAGAGSIAGGFVGALIGAGIPQEHAAIFENGVKKGDILISVTSDNLDDEDALIADWKKFKARDIF